MQAQPLATGFDARAIGTAVWPKGAVLGAWHIAELLGRGGTAEVWLAYARDGRQAALKLVKPELRGHEAASTLLRREHEVLRRVASPHLVRPYELVDAGGGTVALALEYLPLGDLVPLLGASARCWLAACRDLVDALLALERRGLAHGDLKPRNVLFAADGSARLADLTSARALDDCASAATPAYSPPPGARASARDGDLFALGALTYELATGRLPYGLEGPARLGDAPAAAAVRDGGAAELLAVAAAALREGGRGPGLSQFRDVIESVRAHYG